MVPVLDQLLAVTQPTADVGLPQWLHDVLPIITAFLGLAAGQLIHRSQRKERRIDKIDEIDRAIAEGVARIRAILSAAEPERAATAVTFGRGEGLFNEVRGEFKCARQALFAAAVRHPDEVVCELSFGLVAVLDELLGAEYGMLHTHYPGAAVQPSDEVRKYYDEAMAAAEQLAARIRLQKP